MFEVYFESFLFIHIYIFTKVSFNKHPRETIKRKLWATHTTQLMQHTHIMQKNWTHTVIPTHTTMHKMQTSWNANTLSSRRHLANRSVNSTKHTRHLTLIWNISNTHSLGTQHPHTQVHFTTVKKIKIKTGSNWENTHSFALCSREEFTLKLKPGFKSDELLIKFHFWWCGVLVWIWAGVRISSHVLPV